MERTKDIRESQEYIPVEIAADLYPEVTPIEFKRGRKPTSGMYNQDMLDRIEQLTELGLSRDQVAMAIGIHKETLNGWIMKHPELKEAVEYGRWVHDFSVQKSLLMKARGFTVPEVKHVTGVDSIGRPYSYTTTTKKYYPPDMTAIIFWLKNRHREDWRDAYTKNDTTINLDLRRTLNLNTLSKDEVGMLEDIAMKQIEDMNGIAS